MHAHKSYVISLSSCIVNWSVRSTSFITIFYSCIIEVFSAEEGIQMVYLKTSILRVKYKKHASNTASLNVNLYIMLNRFWENLVKNLFLIKKKDKPNLEENNCSKLISSSFNWFYVVQEIYQLNSILILLNCIICKNFSSTEKYHIRIRTRELHGQSYFITKS